MYVHNMSIGELDQQNNANEMYISNEIIYVGLTVTLILKKHGQKR